MQALRKIYEVTSDTITVNIPKTFPAKKVEVIVLPVIEIREDNIWDGIDEIRQELERSGRTFSDSVELIREDRGL